MNNLCNELLLVSLGIKECLSHTYTDKEWDGCYAFADKQAIVGVFWGGIDRLPQEQQPYLDMLMEWLGQTEILVTRSHELDKACVKMFRNFRASGFNSVILKGQGNAKLYPKNLVRTPGDIDVWVLAPREEICQYLRENVPAYTGEHEGYLHTEFEWYTMGAEGADNPGTRVTVEVHFTATYLTSPKHSKRLCQWLQDVTKSFNFQNVPEDDFPTPTLEFNLVYLMLHMYRHYLFEGIGLRHVVDYFLALQKSTQEQRNEAYKVLEWLGAADFTAAMMYVLTENMKLETELLLCKPDTWRGGMLWEAILEGGNFGKAEKTNSDEYRRWGVKRIWRFMMRMPRLFFAYPNEIGWHILRRIAWKK